MSASIGGRARRRLSLLAGGSLAALAIVLSAAGTPTAALAANECAPIGTDPSANGASADTFACAGSYSGTGITYTSVGSLTVNSTGAMDVGAVGINLTGTGSDAVAFTATGVITGTAGPILDVSSVSGPINIETRGLTGTNVNVTYGINAVSTGGGAITVANPTGVINVGATGVASQQAAIRAVSTGGAGAVSVTTGTQAVTGRVYGIQAQASGTGALTITTTNVTVSNTAGVGIAAIDAVSGTGLLTVNITGQNTTPNGQGPDGRGGAAIRANAGGNMVINIGTARTIGNSSATNPVLDLTAVGAVTLNNLGLIRPGSTGGGVRVTASTLTLNNSIAQTPPSSSGSVTAMSGWMEGRLDLTGVSGDVVFNNEGRWSPAAATDFGPGTSELNNSGRIDGGSMTGLETLNNSGVIQFEGSPVTFAGRLFSAPGTDFIASGASKIDMAAVLGVTGQTSCAARPVADCVSLTGGSTSGVTSILVRTADPTGNAIGSVAIVTSQNNTAGIVLVDVNGGVSHAGDFILHWGSDRYLADSVYGGVLSSPGVLGFALQYDAANQRHYLVSVVPGNRLEYVASLQEVFSIWNTTSDVVAGRQADLRDSGGDRFWIRASGERTTHDVDTSLTAGGSVFSYADAYELKTATVVGGYDLLAGEMAGGDFVIGVHGGAIKASLERQASPTTDETQGVVAGFYGGWWGETGLSLDGALNANFLTLDHDRPVEEVSNTAVTTLGARIEAGWRLPLGESFYVQPLATASWARADAREVEQNGFDALWDDLQSTSAALGLRVGGDADMGGARLGWWAIGRTWKEFAGEGVVTLDTIAEDVALRDDLDSEFQEAGVGLNLSNAAGTLSGFFSGGAKFGDTADSYSVSFGARLRW